MARRQVKREGNVLRHERLIVPLLLATRFVKPSRLLRQGCQHKIHDEYIIRKASETLDKIAALLRSCQLLKLEKTLQRPLDGNLSTLSAPVTWSRVGHLGLESRADNVGEGCFSTLNGLRSSRESERELSQSAGAPQWDTRRIC